MNDDLDEHADRKYNDIIKVGKRYFRTAIGHISHSPRLALDTRN